MKISYEHNPKLDEIYPHVVKVGWEEYNFLALAQKQAEVKRWMVPLIEHHRYFYLPGVGYCFKEQEYAELFMLRWA